MCAWTLGIVIGFMLIVRREANKQTLHEVQTLRSYGFLYLGYEHQCWYWEMIKRFQQLLYGLVTTLPMAGGIKARLVMYCLLSGLSAILHVAVQPFDDRNNQML